jgi:hypothetical protein
MNDGCLVFVAQEVNGNALRKTNQLEHAVREPLTLLPMGIGEAAFGEHISRVLVFMIVEYLGLHSNFGQHVFEK